MGIREQEQDTRQILFRSLVTTIPADTIVEVWSVRATGTHGIGHYVILLDEGTHLCTCLLLINKGLNQILYLAEPAKLGQSNLIVAHVYSE
jgi:hypothetical protein